jgi:NAD(P)-dependent dehydrogenase (short-subunit alcohol dehydrogenase family)
LAITGSSRGLGRALAEAALAAGENVVATARNPDQVQDLVKRYPRSARAVRLDVTDRAQAAAAVEATIDAFGRLDVLVNNAGYANVNSIEDSAEDDFRAQIETNLWGVINVTRAAVPVLREQACGHILQISSVGGRDTTPGLGPYQTAKWAVEGFSGVLQKELAPLGIHVTLIEPGGVRTDWAGASMHVADIRSVYPPTVGLIAEYAASGTPRSDPFKTAQAVLQITKVDDPPLRLLLGSYAFTIARAADEAKITSDERWKNLTLSTDADGVSREDQAGAHIPADAPAVTPTPTNAPLILVATNRLKPGQLRRAPAGPWPRRVRRAERAPADRVQRVRQRQRHRSDSRSSSRGRRLDAKASRDHRRTRRPSLRSDARRHARHSDLRTS